MEWSSLDTFISVVFIIIGVCIVAGTLMDITITVFGDKEKKANKGVMHESKSYGFIISL